MTCRNYKVKTSLLKVFAQLLIIVGILLVTAKPKAMAQEVPPLLEFPEIGLDDTTTYRGYTTRFYQDSEGNTLQIYIKQKEGRVVNLWADAANESISFTVRDSEGQPASLTWDSPTANLKAEGKVRYIEYSLVSNTPTLELGHFVLNTMRLEREFQYFKKHLQAFDSEPFISAELIELINNLERLSEAVRDRHLSLLRAQSVDALHSRLTPQIKIQSKSHVLVTQPTFDGKNHLSLELKVDKKQVKVEVSKHKISLQSLHGQPVKLTIKIGSDSPSLTPIKSKEIFNDKFFRFYSHTKSPRLQRKVKSMELLSSQEKLMAGIPNYATYFGRDMMMSALMLEPVLRPEMLEHVITSVLNKLKSNGEVSHEEGIGSQAIRENAAKYNKLLSKYFEQKDEDDKTVVLTDAERYLTNLQKTTENYHMVDDDFQLAVLTARYLKNVEISNGSKREFLQSALSTDAGTSRLKLLIRNLIYVSKVSQAYAEDPIAENLISFKKLDDSRWHAGSWRDSAVGYANGRYAMDINAIWVPKALESLESIFAALRQLGISISNLQKAAPEARNTKLIDYWREPETLKKAVKTWQNAFRHFEVKLTGSEVQQQVRAKLDWLSKEERSYWEKVLAKSAPDKDRVEFLAISLDEKGLPIPVVHTDISTWLFLENLVGQILSNKIQPEDVLKRLRMSVTSYPVGLFIEGVGPVVANDVYASSNVWENFRKDLYHSPRVVWGREVNLLFLGLTKQIIAAYDSKGRIKDPGLGPYVQELRAILEKTLRAVEASGLKHNELWSYKIDGGELQPARYATTTDIQLWNLTNLAVQFLLERI